MLVPALDCDDQAVQEGAPVALLKRRTPAGGREILDRMTRMKPEWRTIIRRHRGRMTGALRDAILGQDQDLCEKGCRAGRDVPRVRPAAYAADRVGQPGPSQRGDGRQDGAGVGARAVRGVGRRARPRRPPRPANGPPLRADQPGIVDPPFRPPQVAARSSRASCCWSRATTRPCGRCCRTATTPLFWRCSTAWRKAPSGACCGCC